MNEPHPFEEDRHEPALDGHDFRLDHRCGFGLSLLIYVVVNGFVDGFDGF